MTDVSIPRIEISTYSFGSFKYLGPRLYDIIPLHLKMYLTIWLMELEVKMWAMQSMPT